VREVVPGGMETWGGRRSAAYLPQCCGPLLPFLREGGRVQALENSPKAGCLLAAWVWVWERFWRILQKHFVNNRAREV